MEGPLRDDAVAGWVGASWATLPGLTRGPPTKRERVEKNILLGGDPSPTLGVPCVPFGSWDLIFF